MKSVEVRFKLLLELVQSLTVDATGALVPLDSPPAALPSPLGCRSLGHAAFTALQVLLGCPTTHPASLSISLALIGSLIPMPLGNRMSPPGVTSRSSVPCHPQTPW